MARNSCPWALFGPSSCKWGLWIPVFWLAQKALSSFVRMELLWLVRAVQLWLDGENLSPLGWNRIPEILYNGWLRWQETQFQHRLLCEVQFGWEAPVQKRLVGSVFFFNLIPVSHQEFSQPNHPRLHTWQTSPHLHTWFSHLSNTTSSSNSKYIKSDTVYCKHFSCTSLVLTLTQWERYLSLCYREENRYRRFSNLSWVTQLLRDGAKIQTKAGINLTAVLDYVWVSGDDDDT